MLETCKFIKKETPTPVLSSDFCGIFKNTHFVQHLRMASSEYNITNTINTLIKFIEIKRLVRMFSCSQILVACKIELFHQMFNWFEKRSNVNIKKKTYLRKLKEGSAGTLVPLWIRNCPEM